MRANDADADQVISQRFDCFTHFLFCTLLASLFLLPRSVGARTLPNAAHRVRQEGTRIAEAVRVDHAPRLDGTLNDPLWQAANPITEFRQREPYEGVAPTEKTEVRILYTQHALWDHRNRTSPGHQSRLG